MWHEASTYNCTAITSSTRMCLLIVVYRLAKSFSGRVAYGGDTLPLLLVGFGHGTNIHGSMLLKKVPANPNDIMRSDIVPIVDCCQLQMSLLTTFNVTALLLCGCALQYDNGTA